MNKYELRRLNFKAVLKNFRTQKEFSELSGVSTVQISQLISGHDKYKIGHEIARKIEKAAAKPDGWLDIDHEGEQKEVEDIDLIIRTISIVNTILDEHDMQVHRMKREAYEDILRNAITNSVKLGIVSESQVQHSLFSAQLRNFAH